ncbi:hypothetical protein [Streptomyces sp. NBC_01361]|nr:hypothetical protein [Streptomyces sp. NBC_01361]
MSFHKITPVRKNRKPFAPKAKPAAHRQAKQTPKTAAKRRPVGGQGH